MEYDVIATLGPASQSENTWQEMLSAGATAFRLNTSHLTLAQLSEWLDRLAPFLASAGPQVSLVLDLQGSKWRLGNLAPRELTPGQTVRLVHAVSSNDVAVLPVPHGDFFIAAQQSNSEIVLNDAKVSLVVESAGPDWIAARVARGGPISANKGITFTASCFRHESLSEKDQTILAETRGLGFVHYAVSYVKDAAEMKQYRVQFGLAYLIAKLERSPAIEQAAELADSADELWLCRGDLGAELGLKGMAEAVHGFTQQVRRLLVPAVMAGQVLEHMAVRPVPTRAEICALYDALAAGYQGVVLSDETAVGPYPVESCKAAGLFRR